MAYESVKNQIDAYIKANGVNLITGPVLNAVLTTMLDKLGEGYAFQGVLNTTDTPSPAADIPQAWLAAAGSYLGGSITVDEGELALIIHTADGWSKETVYRGVQLSHDAIVDALGYAPADEADLAEKQDTISDLSDIRSGAALGSTSVQPADIENMVEAEPIGSIIPPVNPSEFATKEELSQLEAKVYELLPDETGPTITPNYSEGERFKNGNIGTSTQFGHFEPILLPAHCTIVLNDGNNVYWSNIAVVYECDSAGNFIRPILTDGNYQSKPAIYTNDLDTDIYVGISCYKTTLKYCIKTPIEPVDYFEAKGDAIKNYILSESFTVVSATYDSEGIVSSASVKWPDGTTGTISVTRDSDGNTAQVVATQGQDTYTLSITRNATGQVTATSIVKS